MKSNITIVCAINTLCKKVAEDVAKKFDFYAVDVQDFLVFNMVDEQKTTETCGIDYLNKLQQNAISEVANYYDTVISVHPKFLMEKKNAAVLKKKSIVVFLQINKSTLELYAKVVKDKEQKSAILADALVAPERDKAMQTAADIVLDFSKLNEKLIVKKISREISKFITK